MQAFAACDGVLMADCGRRSHASTSLDARWLPGERNAEGARKIYGGNKNFFLASNRSVVAMFPLRRVARGAVNLAMM